MAACIDDITLRMQSASLNTKPKVKVFVISTASDLSKCSDLKNCDRLAFDCEGVDLGRNGELSIVQLSSHKECYLFDVLGAKRTSEVVLFLKDILENSSIQKIIHDCKMDSDALYHILDINVAGCHDTQVWDLVMTSQENNLNRTLLSYNCETNPVRNTNVYVENNRFWATRPLTKAMIEWASEDVLTLFQLRKAQRKVADNLPKGARVKEFYQQECDQRIRFLRDKVCVTCQIDTSMIGLFIGRRGANMKSLCEGSIHYYQPTGPKGCGRVDVYSDSQSSMRRAVDNLAPYQDESEEDFEEEEEEESGEEAAEEESEKEDYLDYYDFSRWNDPEYENNYDSYGDFFAGGDHDPGYFHCGPRGT